MIESIRQVGKGVKQSRLRAIYIHLDPDVFAQIYARARKEKTSFSEQARTLIEWGLESEKKHL